MMKNPRVKMTHPSSQHLVLLMTVQHAKEAALCGDGLEYFKTGAEYTKSEVLAACNKHLCV